MNQSTNWAVTISTRSKVRHGPRGLISSVLCNPVIASTRASMLL